jgi:hypothetical protein
MINIAQEFEKFNLLFDKTTQSYQTLPYEEDKALIAPNDFVRSALINKKLYYLHYNFLFLYKLSNFADFSIPKTTIFKFKGNNTELFEETFRKNVSMPDTGLYESLRGAVSYNIPIKGNTVLFYNTKDNLCAISIDRSSVDLLTRTPYVDPLSGTITFSNITDMQTNERGDLYVVDNDYKNIYLYDVQPIIRNDGIYRQLPFLKNVIGGVGLIQENSKFGNIRNIGVNLNYVVVEDDVNNCIKVLDKNLNWLNTVPLKTFFETEGHFDALSVDSFNRVHAIIDKKLYVYNIDQQSNLFLSNTFDISSYIKREEVVKYIKFTKQNPYVFYIFTNKAIKKVWSTDPTGCIGEFLLEGELQWGDVFLAGNEEDTLMLKMAVPESDNQFRLNGYNDILQISSLLTNPEFDIYDFEDIKIEQNEYVSSWVFQKAIRKIFYNVNSLIKQVKFRLIEDNKTISVIINRIYNQIFLNYSSPTKDPFNLNVGQNEIFQAEVINRILSEIIILQRTILLYVLNNKTTRVYYSPSPQSRLKNVISYTYYADESISIFPNPMKLQPLEELVPLDGIMISLGGAPYRSGEGVSVTDGILT